MSDRSSNTDFRSSIAHITQDPQVAKSLDSLHRPYATVQPDFSSRRCFEGAQATGLTIYAPVGIPAPLEVPFSEAFPSMANMFVKHGREGIAVETQVIVSKSEAMLGHSRLNPDSVLVYEGTSNLHLPSYYPKYMLAPPDTQLYKQVFHHYTTSVGLSATGEHITPLPGYDNVGESSYCFGAKDSLKYYGEHYGYTSGTLQGQLTRLRENQKVNMGEENYHGVKTLKQQKLTFDDVGKILSRFLPLPPFRENHDLPLSGNYSNYVTLMENNNKKYLFAYMPTFQTETKAGLPFRQAAKKGDVRWDAIVGCNNFLYDLTVALETQDIKVIQEHMKKYWFLSVGYLFPKAERYEMHTVEREEYTYIPEKNTVRGKEKTTYKKTSVGMKSYFESKKTRNIWSMPFITHILASQNKIKLSEDVPINIDNSDTPSLYKWSPWKGGMDRLITKLVNFIDEFKKSKLNFKTFSLAYADNWYVLECSRKDGKFATRWLSLDQTKGESNITRSHMAAFENYVLNTSFTTKVGDRLTFYYNSTWGYFYRNLLPAMTINMAGLLGNMLLKIPGQGSGNTNTFFVNHTATALCIDYYEKKGLNKSPITQDVLNKMAQVTGVDWKIELDVPLHTQLTSAMESPTKYDGLSPPTVVKLDIVGYDAVYFESTKQFAPVLARDRLFKSAMLPKNFKSENQVVKTLYSNIRYNSLLLSGAWAYPTLRMALEGLANTNYNYLLKFNDLIANLSTNTSKEVEMPIDFRELTDPDILVYLSGASLPPTEDTMRRLTTGESIQHGEIAPYVPLRELEKTKNQLGNKLIFNVVPGMNIEMPVKKSAYETDLTANWGEMADEFETDNFIQIMSGKSGFSKMTANERRKYNSFSIPGKKVVELKINSHRDTVLKFYLANDSSLVADNTLLYTQISNDMVYSKFTSTISPSNLYNPAEEGVHFDKTGKITRDTGKKIARSFPDKRDIDKFTRNQKKNLKRQYKTFEAYKPVTPLPPEEMSKAAIDGAIQNLKDMEALAQAIPDYMEGAWEDYLTYVQALKDKGAEFTPMLLKEAQDLQDIYLSQVVDELGEQYEQQFYEDAD